MLDEARRCMAQHDLDGYKVDLSTTGLERLTGEDLLPLLLSGHDAHVNKVAQFLPVGHDFTVSSPMGGELLCGAGSR